MRLARMLVAAGILLFVRLANAQPGPSEGPYKLIKSEKVGGPGRWDYVFADADGRRLYIPRTGSGQGGGNPRVTVFDLDTLQSAGEIPNTVSVHGVAIDPKSGHGFTSSKPVVMFDTKTLATIRTIAVDGNPDGILFDPGTDQVFVLSHRAPNVTVIKSSDGSVAGTIDLGGAPEQAASDGAGRVYVDVEDKDKVAVVDAKALKVITDYDLSGKGGGPAGLALDRKNHILFSFCHNPQTAVILNADDGKIITTLPIGNGVDAAEFNPDTLEAFSSQGDGTLTVIKENSPTDFAVEQTVKTKRGARTSTLDAKTGQIYLITAEQAPPATRPATNPTGGATANAQGGGQPRGNGGGRGGQMAPDSFTILVVGK
jgi:hypothetical protein